MVCWADKTDDIPYNLKKYFLKELCKLHVCAYIQNKMLKVYFQIQYFLYRNVNHSRKTGRIYKSIKGERIVSG